MRFGALQLSVLVSATGLAILASAAWAECDSSKTSKPSSARFVVKGETAYDKKTDLTWMRCSQGQKWKEDVGCVGLPQKFTHDQANKDWTNGWRMPTIDELKTIVAKNCKDPAIDDEIFPDTPSEWYHTSSKRGSNCWHVHFGDGSSNYSNVDYDFAVRLVRSGQ